RSDALARPSPTRARGSATRARSSSARPARASGAENRGAHGPHRTTSEPPAGPMNEALAKTSRRERRAFRVRKKLRATCSLPRLCVSRSLKHIQAQIIDDSSGRTLAHASSTDKGLSGELTGKKKTERAAVIGTELARKAKEAGIQQVVFDRGFARFHGRVK